MAKPTEKKLAVAIATIASILIAEIFKMELPVESLTAIVAVVITYIIAQGQEDKEVVKCDKERGD